MAKYVSVYDPGIHVPAINSCFVSRARLKELSQERQITVLQAEGGMGKTIFLTAAAHHFSGRCVWCDLEAAGNSAAGFAALLEKAIQVVNPGFSFGWGDLPEDVQPGDIAFSLLRALNDLAQEPLLLIFDNVQEFVCGSAEILFSVLLKGAHPGLRLMFATKAIFPVPLAMYQAKGKVCVIDRHLLCFHSREISELLYTMTGVQGQDRLVEEILEYTEGWPLAVMLILMRLQQLGPSVSGNPMIRQGRKSLSLKHLLKDMQMFQYIAGDVFGKMEQSLQQFLLTTSILDNIEPAVCNYLTKQKNSHQILEYLASHNLFISRIDGEREWYRYHSILLDFLRDRISSEQCCAVQKNAAAYFMATHDFEQGTVYAIRAGDPECILQAVEQYGPELLQKGQLELLGRWAALLTTTEWTGRIPELTVRCSYLLSRYYLYTGKPKEAVAFLDKSCRMALEQKEKRFFSHYFYELEDDLEKLEQISLKRQLLQVFMDAEVSAVDWMKDKYSRGLLKKWTEYSLSQNVHEQIRMFYSQAMLVPSYRGSDMSLIHHNIILSLQQKLTGEELLAAAREVRLYSEVLSDFGYYQYMTQAYRKDQAERIAGVMGELPDTGESNGFRAMCRMYDILIQYQKGQVDAAFLRQEVSLLRRILQEQNQQFPFLKPEDRRLLFRLLSEKDGEKGKLRQTLPAETVPGATDSEEYVLRVICLDGMQVLTADGSPITWRTKKAKELFFRLFALRGSSCDKQTLMEDLWPEGERDKVSALFDTTLSYLKKGLKAAGAGQVLLSAKRAYSLDMKRMTSDLAELTELLVRYEKQEWLPEESPTEIRKLYRQGLLRGEDYLWAAFEQEHLERRVINALTTLAGHFYIEGNYAGSIETAHFALEINPFNESLVRLLLDSYVSDGQMGKAKKMQTFYEKLWAEELGESPEFTKLIG